MSTVRPASDDANSTSVQSFGLRIARSFGKSGLRTHVHDENACLVQLVDGPPWGDADGTDKEFRLLLDDDVDEVGQLTLCVVVLKHGILSAHTAEERLGECTDVGLAGIPTDLRNEQVDAEWGVLVMQTTLDLVNLKAR